MRFLSQTPALLLSLGLLACGAQQPEPAAVAHAESDGALPSEAAPGAGGSPAQLEPHVDELLEVCIEAASRFPLNPHIKNRSRAQELAVEAAFELGDLERGLRYANRIENWRRGSCYADYAYRLSDAGDSPEVQEYLDKAAQWIETGEGNDWRTYQIRYKIARVHERLGQDQEARAILVDLPEQTTVEQAEYEAERSRLTAEEEFDERIAWVDRAIQVGTLDDVMVAFSGLTVLYDRFYEDATRRALIEEKLRSSRSKAPLDITLETLGTLGRTALEHGDREHALELAGELGELFASASWVPEDELQRAAPIAELRFLAGDEEGALAELSRLRKRFELKRKVIYDIYRADALTPVAAAYARAGDEATARSVYAQALEESVENPNSRPRVDDLIQICLSMVEVGLDPGPELMARIREVEGGLGDPW